MHSHHIVPRHRGGTNHQSNLVRLSVTQHCMWHWAEFFYTKHPYDKIAACALAGQIGKDEIARELSIANAKLGKGGMNFETRSKAGKIGGKVGYPVRITKDGESRLFQTQKEACQWLGISMAYLSAILNGHAGIIKFQATRETTK